MSHTKANQLRCSLQLCLVTYMLKAIVGETRHTKPTKPRNPRHHMQNRAFSKSQQFCKAISIYSRSSQDVGLEVFDVLTIFFFASFDTEYIVLPSCNRLSHFVSKMGKILLSLQVSGNVAPFRSVVSYIL